jgi:Holliday junction resolvasome RuvABC endonuclease subunit
MQKVLSLDISSSTIGWSLIEYDSQSFTLIDYGYLKPPKSSKGSLSYRLNETVSMITNLITQHHPDEVAVEDYARKFTKGRSTAHTIIILSTFNEVVCLTAYRIMKQDAYRYPVSTIRSQVGKLFGTKIVSKDDIFPEITQRAKIFQAQLNRNNNIKKESMDVADAIAVGIAHVLKRSPNAKRYSI